MTMFTPGDRSEKIGMTLDSLVASESWGEIWRATHDKLSKILVVAYKREEGRNLFLAAREGLDIWKRLAESGKPGLLRIHKIVSSGKIPMLIVEDPGGETAREFFGSDAATLKKTARMVRDCCHTLTALQSEHLRPVGVTPDTIIRKEGDKDYPSYLIPVSPGVFGDAVRLGDGRYVSPDALLLGDRESVNADVYSLAWIWAELLARDHTLDHQASRLRDTVHYPKLREIIRKALVFRDDHYPDPRKLEFEADQWLENDATADREAYELWAEKQKNARRKRRRARRRNDRAADSAQPSVAPAGGKNAKRDREAGGDGIHDEFDDFAGAAPDHDEEEDELAFAGDIPPMAEPSVRKPSPQGPPGTPGRGAAASDADSQRPQDASSNFFPILLTGCFVLVIISAFAAGIGMLLGIGDGAQTPVQVAVTGDEEPLDPAPADVGAEPVEPGTPQPPAPDPEAGAVPPPDAGGAEIPDAEPTPSPSPTPAARPDSVEALVGAFHAANRQRDLEAIRALYFEEREFEALRGVLAGLGAEDGELATLNFVERSGDPAPDAEIQSVGMLRVSTSAFNLEIPVGRQGDRFFLTSVGRIGGLPAAAPAPEPTEEPLEFATWSHGEWPTAVSGRRLLRLGLGDEAQAVIVLNRAAAGDEPFELKAMLSNPLAEEIYYQFAIEVTDAEGRLLTVGSGGGVLEAGTSEISRQGEFFAGNEVLAEAAAYEARWYESKVPLGLVGGQVTKNPRIPVGFGRGYMFQMGDQDRIQGRIYTEYISNQKVIAAPVLLSNQEARSLDALCSVAFYDSNGRFVSGRSQRTRVEPSSVKPFDNLICAMPQAAYGEVTSFQAVMVVDGAELARTEATLPQSEVSEDVISAAAPTPAPTPRVTPTPLPASAAGDSTDYRSPDEEMSVEEAIAMMEPARRSESPAPAEGEAATTDFEAAGEVSSTPEPFSDEDVERFGRMASGIGTAWTIFSVVFGYFIAAFCFQKIMEKSGKQDLALVAWIPVINWIAVPWLISGRSIMFPILAFVVPCLGIFFYIAMWYDVCVARNKNGVWAFVAVFIPILGVPYLAFSE